MIDPATSKKKIFFMGITLLVLTLFSYANTLHSPLNFDDHAVIQQLKKSTHQLKKNNVLVGKPIDTYRQIIPLQHRHLFHLSFSINHSQWGTNPFGYHLINITFHFLTSLVLLFIVFFTLENGTDWHGKHALGIAGLTAILFTINPLNTETVTYISGRASGMAGFFYLTAILSFILGSLKKYSGKFLLIPFYIFTLVAFLAAVLSKETSLTLPAIIILYDLSFMKNNQWVSFKSRLLFLYLPFLFSLFALLIFQHSLQLVINSWAGKLDFDYGLAQAQIIGHAFKLCLFPINLTFNYDFTPNWFAEGLFQWVPVLLWLTLVAVILKNFRKLSPVVPFSIFWFILTISITNSFLPRADLLSERNLYLPSIGPLLLISCAFYHFLIKQGSLPFRQGLALILLIVVIHSSLTIKRNTTYRSNIDLWEDTLKKSPSDLKVLHNLSHFYLEKKNNEKALVTLIKLSRSNASAFYKSFAHSNLGSIHAQNKNFDLAEKEFNKAIQADPTIPLGYLNLGIYYASRGLHQKAKTMLEMARDRYQKYRWGYAMPASLNFSLAHVNFKLGFFSEAEKGLKRFLTETPESPNGLLLLGKIYQQMGKTDSAIVSYQKIKGNPEIEAKAFNNLGLIYLSLNQPQKALLEFESSLRTNPKLPDTHYNLGKLIIDSNGDIELARGHLNTAFSLTKSPALKAQIKNLLLQTSRL
jgi:protein O-mannosyl-transferase